MEIKRDKRKSLKGKFFHKSPNIKCSHTKTQAISDIAKDTGAGEFYTKMYINIESTVLKACACKMVVYSINTNLL